MRILLLMQWFDPEPFFKGLAFARALAGRGHDVQVLTGFPNYPGGRVYEGYRLRWRQREEIDGVRITRVPLYPSHDGSSVRRTLNYASFALAASTIGAASVRRPDVIYVYHPPGTVGLPAMVLKALRGCPFVYDIQDLWPDSVAASGMMSNARVNALLGRWCHLVYRRANRVVVLSPGLKRVLVDRDVPAEKIDVIYNWCDEASLGAAFGSEDDRRELGFAGRYNVVFAGTMGKAQALDSVLDAAALLSRRAPSVQLVLVGGGIEVPRLKEAAEAAGLPNVRFLPRQPVDRIGRVLTLADALLVHLKDDPLFRITIPSKTQAYMAIGKPIIMAVTGDAADLVSRAGCGICCEPERPQPLAEAIERMSRSSAEDQRRMGQDGREFYRAHLSMAAGVERFEEVFKRAVAEAR